MNVPVDNQNSVETMDRSGMGGCHSNVVEQTEAHGLGPESMMTGGANEREGPLRFSGQYFVDGRECRPRRQQSHVKTLCRHHSVDIQPSAPRLGRLLELLDVSGIMDAADLLNGGPTSPSWPAQLADSVIGQLVADRSNPRGGFGMPAGLMLLKSGVLIDRQHRKYPSVDGMISDGEPACVALSSRADRRGDGEAAGRAVRYDGDKTSGLTL